MSKIDKVKQCLFQIIFFGGFMNYSQIFLSLINNGYYNFLLKNNSTNVHVLFFGE